MSINLSITHKCRIFVVIKKIQTMNEIQVTLQDLQNFENFVKSMKVNIRYMLPVKLRYKWLKIEKKEDFHTNEVYYSWEMEYNYPVAKMAGYIFPISYGSMVSSFKTEIGAKRNFIKKYSYYFTNPEIINP